MKFASLCLLSFNRPQFVVDAISSLYQNAGYPYELIVHDDGSDEETTEVLRQFLASGLISTLILNPPGHNQGQGIALNRMFQMAKGDPIVKLDHDLIFHNGWLRRCVEIIEANHSDEARVYEDDRIGALGLFKYHTDPVHHEEMHLRSHGPYDEVKDFVGSAMVIPRLAWETFGPFAERSEAFAEDYEFKMKVAEAEGWCNALVSQDVARNQGFGLGPSTVVAQKEDGSLTSAKIEPDTFVIGRQWDEQEVEGLAEEEAPEETEAGGTA